MERSYLVRYGFTSEVGRFSADDGADFERGETVVVRSHRGTELGEVLVEAPTDFAGVGGPVDGLARVLRAAGDEDRRRGSLVEAERPARYEDCRRVLGDGLWPIELIDVEPLLDDRRVVLHYLGPHRLDTAGLLAVFRESFGLDVLFHAVGLDDDGQDESPAESDDHGHGCGEAGCGSGGCGTASGAGSACSGCAVKQLLGARR